MTPGEEALSDLLDQIMALSVDKNARIASLESQLKDKDRIISEYRSLLDPILDWGWGASPESGIKLGQSITEEVLRLAKESRGKDQEIERLKDAIKSRNIDQEEDALLIADLRESLRKCLRQWSLSNDSRLSQEFVDRCRKLIE